MITSMDATNTKMKVYRILKKAIAVLIAAVIALSAFSGILSILTV